MKDKLVLKIKLTRAEYLSKLEQEELGTNEGLVINEYFLDKTELKQEYDRIIDKHKEGYESGLREYENILYNSMKISLDKFEKESLRETNKTTKHTEASHECNECSLLSTKVALLKEKYKELADINCERPIITKGKEDHFCGCCSSCKNWYRSLLEDLEEVFPAVLTSNTKDVLKSTKLVDTIKEKEKNE